MDVVHDVLDKQIVDRNGREMGRADGIVLDVGENAPPRLAEVLIGASVLGARVNHAQEGAIDLQADAKFLTRHRPVRLQSDGC